MKGEGEQARPRETEAKRKGRIDNSGERGRVRRGGGGTGRSKGENTR